MGDCNAKIDNENADESHGKHWLDKINESEKKLVDLMTLN